MSNIQPLELALELAFEPVNRPRPQPALNLAATTHSVEINRLLVAAVVNRRFCRLLLVNPILALATGYRGQPFKLTAAERSCILAIRACSLQDFAQQLTTTVAMAPVPLLHPQWIPVFEILKPLQLATEACISVDN